MPFSPGLRLATDRLRHASGASCSPPVLRPVLDERGALRAQISRPHMYVC